MITRNIAGIEGIDDELEIPVGIWKKIAELSWKNPIERSIYADAVKDRAGRNISRLSICTTNRDNKIVQEIHLYFFSGDFWYSILDQQGLADSLTVNTLDETFNFLFNPPVLT